MCKLIRKIICLIIIAAILFTAITMWGKGGGKFRWLGEKTGGFIKKGANKLGDKADEYKEKADVVQKKVKGWTSKDDEESEKK